MGLPELLGLTAALIEIAKASGDAVRLLSKSFPETGRFWKEFERQLKHDYDVPWDDIRAHCYLQPEFFGLILGLVYGDADSLSKMEQHFTGFIEPPECGRYSKTELVARVMLAAEHAASEAAVSDRQAGEARRRLLENRIGHATREVLQATVELKQDIGSVQETLEQQEGAQSAFFARADEHFSEIRALLSLMLQTMPAPVIDRSQLEQLFENQTNELSRRQEEALDRVFAKRDQPTLDRPLPSQAPDAGAEVPRQLGPGPDASGWRAPRDHIAALRDEDAVAADRLQGILDGGGVFAVATAIKQGQVEEGPPELLVAAAKLVADAGFTAEAESAYLRAARLLEEPRARARQYVRASAMATLQRAPDRSKRHMDAARELAPNHPALLLAEARTSSDSQFMLDHVADVEPEGDTERALLHQTRAQALLALGREEEARAEYELARAADPDDLSVREFAAILPWFTAHRQLERGDPVDVEALKSAARAFEALAAETSPQGRIDETAQVLARAAECHLFAGEPAEAQRVLSTVPDRDRLSLESALALAEVAFLVGKPELALDLVPAGATHSHTRLVRAEALVLLPDSDERAKGVPVLRELLADNDDEIATKAAFALISASAIWEDVPWDETAAEIVGRRKLETEVALRAERALLLGDPQEAQRLLLPYAGRIQTARRLRYYAALAGEWEKVKDRSRDLLRRANDPRDRLALAEACRHLGEEADAEREFLAVASDQTAPDEARDAAFGALAELAGSTRDYERVRTVALEWHSTLPSSANATWNLLFALARLSRHTEAWELAHAADPDPDTEARATLLGEILHRAAPKPEALRRLIDLSDRFDRRVEAVEALIISTALDAEREEVETDPAVEGRVRETFASFPNRFPDSNVIRAIPAPQTPEEIEAFLKELAGERPRLQQEVSEGVAAGRAPINALAAVSPAGVGKTWSRLEALPLGFAMPELDEADREAAAGALGSAAVWDPSALFVVTSLGRNIEHAFRSVLPGSMIVTETLEDADSDACQPGKPAAETVHTPSGDVGVRKLNEDELERERVRAEETLRLAKDFNVQPAKGPGGDSRLIERYDGSADQDDLRAVFGTLLLAQRTGRAVYSDDRFIREAARSLGIPAFGTLPLADAMAEQAMLAADLRRSLRIKLAVRGGWGVQLDGEELVQAAAQEAFVPAASTLPILRDRARWRADPAAALTESLALLAAVRERAPENFSDWVRRVLEAAQAAVPEMPKWWWVEVMLIAAWWPPKRDEAGDGFLQALIEEAGRLPEELTAPGYDPVIGPLNRTLAYLEAYSEAERLAVFEALCKRLTETDQQRARETFLREPPEDGSAAE